MHINMNINICIYIYIYQHVCIYQLVEIFYVILLVFFVSGRLELMKTSAMSIFEREKIRVSINHTNHSPNELILDIHYMDGGL